ncbi:MAG: HIT family protein [Hymenobacteraceae bacterium]|nr:HIT family protein [Hymenobacteraceae bacterium]MDX5396720.1 HIT family protein [Hymenobacteraceae bacterium]MDX5442197.1 HIT family protein [Hymenobacteraceae bacterium]MDX5512780.1 HIT family protein [Hymenobacteraceae bacterium]
MESVFSKIVKGDIPAYKVAEDAEHLAFLDINPLVKGHTLVIPKKETDYIFDLEDDAFARLQLFSKKVAKAIEKSVSCKRVGVCVIGFEVPHAHIHLIPINNMDDMNFRNPKLKLEKAEFEAIAAEISHNF